MNRRFASFTGHVLALLLSVLLLSTQSALAQTVPPPTDADPPRTVNVSGTGVVNAEPDLAVVTLGVETQAEEAAAALTQNSEQVQALLDTLTGADVAEEDIQTQTVRLQPQYAQPADPNQPQASDQPTTPAIIGYVATNTVEVRVRDLIEKLNKSRTIAGAISPTSFREARSFPEDLCEVYLRSL